MGFLLHPVRTEIRREFRFLQIGGDWRGMRDRLLSISAFLPLRSANDPTLSHERRMISLDEERALIPTKRGCVATLRSYQEKAVRTSALKSTRHRPGRSCERWHSALAVIKIERTLNGWACSYIYHQPNRVVMVLPCTVLTT